MTGVYLLYNDFPEVAVVNDDLGELCEALRVCIEDLHRVRMKCLIQTNIM